MIDRFELFHRLVNMVPMVLNSGENVLLSKIQLEDGSGYNFIVTAHVIGTERHVKFFINTRSNVHVVMK